MGVPVITRSGDHFLSHIGETIANNTNLSDWIAFDEDDYILKAVNFSFDLNKLKKLRSQLRGKLFPHLCLIYQGFPIILRWLSGIYGISLRGI